MLEGIIWAVSAGIMLGLYALPENLLVIFRMKIHGVYFLL